MFATVIWLMWVLGFQVDSSGVTAVLIGLLLITFAVWLLRSNKGSPARRRVVWLMTLMLLSAAIYLPLQLAGQTVGADQTDGASAIRQAQSRGSYMGPDADIYTAERLAALRKEGPVFINFTAAWCITCQVNEVVALNKASTAKLFSEHNVAYLKGDWTNEDPAITKKLEQYGRSGVPLYLLYGPGTEVQSATILPQVLTEAIVEAYVLKI